MYYCLLLLTYYFLLPIVNLDLTLGSLTPRYPTLETLYVATPRVAMSVDETELNIESDKAF